MRLGGVSWCGWQAVSPGCDVAMGVMPEGKTEGAFSFLHVLPVDAPSLPLISLTHGEQVSRHIL